MWQFAGTLFSFCFFFVCSLSLKEFVFLCCNKKINEPCIFDLLVNAIMHDVEQKRMMWKWETMKKRRVHRIHYIELWKKKLSKKVLF